MTFRPSILSRASSSLIAISAVILTSTYGKLVSRESREPVGYWLTGFVLSNLSQLAYLSLEWRLDVLMFLVALGMLLLTCIACAIAFAWLGLRVFGSRIAFWRNVM